MNPTQPPTSSTASTSPVNHASPIVSSTRSPESPGSSGSPRTSEPDREQDREKADAKVNAIRALHAELDSIAQRPVDETTCQTALLDCLLRSRGMLGGAWYRIPAAGVSADVARLPQAFLNRPDVLKWLYSLAERSASEKADLIGQCPMLRNVTALCIPTNADRRNPTKTESPGFRCETQAVLAVVFTSDQAAGLDVELLAGQCVVRTWRDWAAQQNLRQSKEQLAATSALIDLCSQIQRSENLAQANQVVVERIKEHFGVRLVAYATRKNNRAVGRVEAISGIGEIDAASQQSGRIAAALNAVLLHGELITYPETPTNTHQDLAHKRVAETLGVEAVLSTPIPISNDCTGALLLGGSAAELLHPQTARSIRALSGQMGTAIEVRRQLEGNLLVRSARKLASATRRFRTWAVVAMVCTVVASMWIPVPYRISCRSRIEPVTRRFCSAPYDGLLENTFVEPGDTVSENQLLALMDGRDLSWELSGLTAEAQQAYKQRDVYMADLEVADSLMSELEWEKLVAKEKVLRNKLSRLEIRSPVKGIVLGGSLDRRENYPVTMGQVVYEIAPLDELRMEVAIPAEERSHVETGMQVTIRIDGNAADEVDGEISRILPRSEIRDEQNVFVAEVIVANPDGDLRPGMEGAARITGRNHTLGWTIGHHAWERLLTGVWW